MGNTLCRILSRTEAGCSHGLPASLKGWGLATQISPGSRPRSPPPPPTQETMNSPVSGALWRPDRDFQNDSQFQPKHLTHRLLNKIYWFEGKKGGRERHDASSHLPCLHWLTLAPALTGSKPPTLAPGDDALTHGAAWPGPGFVLHGRTKRHGSRWPLGSWSPGAQVMGGESGDISEWETRVHQGPGCEER